jgi:glycosyltransferase involved in cell wall biosynthesis
LVRTGKILVPWYRYPPSSENRIGGLSVAVWDLTAELAKKGNRVDILTPNPSPEGTAMPAGVRVVASNIGLKFLNNQTLGRDEERSLDDYDRILSVANYAAKSLSSTPLSHRTVRQIHAIGQDREIRTYLTLTPTIVEYLKMAVAKRRDEKNLRLLRGVKTICVSEFLKRRMERGLEDSRNLHVIPNGIRTEQFRPWHTDKDFDLLCISRFQKAKGLDILLRALNLIALQEHQTYSLAIVGDFSAQQREYLLQRVQPGLRGAIRLLGTVQRDDLPNVINRARLVVVPARYESFGLPALEAIACGVPVVASRVGGLPEVIDESVGRLVNPNDAHALAQGIRELIRSPDLAERVLANGPARAKSYDWNRIASDLHAVIFA